MTFARIERVYLVYIRICVGNYVRVFSTSRYLRINSNIDVSQHDNKGICTFWKKNNMLLNILKMTNMSHENREPNNLSSFNFHFKCQEMAENAFQSVEGPTLGFAPRGGGGGGGGGFSNPQTP